MLSFLKSKGAKLYSACDAGDLQTVTSILKTASNKDVNYIDKEGSSPLLLAAHHGHLDIVVALLAHPDVDVKLIDKAGATVLICACSNGHSNVAEALLKHPGVAVNATSHNGSTALIKSAEKGHLEVVKRLLHHGVDVNVQDKGRDIDSPKPDSPKLDSPKQILA